MIPAGKRVIWQAASLCLTYPDDRTVEQGPLLRRALTEAASPAVAHFADLLDRWAAAPLAELQVGYVDLFDLSRRHALHLSYWTDGDTRRRGEVLHSFKQRYRRTGHVVETRGELPDFLPLVLEYAATVDAADGQALLIEYRSSLDLLRLALLERSAPYAGVLTAICETLPGRTPADRREVLARAANGPPTEQVGLQPYDPRLLPLGGRS